jgi:rare lipoprotein A
MRLFLLITLALAGTLPAIAEVCTASQYGVGDGYNGRRAASGRIFNTYAGASGREDDPYTIARPSRADLGRRFRITNLKNGNSIEALSTDLGPFIAGRCVDLGRAGADALGIGGLGFVRVERLD